MNAETILKHQRWLDGWPDGERADYSGAEIADANLAGANLARADFSGARLIRVNLRGARLQGADFTDAAFEDVDLGKASLAGTDFSGADMRGVTSIEETVFPFRCVVAGVKVSDEQIGVALDALVALDFSDNSEDIQTKAAAVRGEA